MAYVVTTVRIDEDKRAELKNRGISLTKLVDDALDSLLELELKDKNTLEKEKEIALEDIKDLEVKRNLAVQRINTEYESALTTLQLQREDQLNDVKRNFNTRIESIRFKIKQLDDLIVKADLRAERKAELEQAKAEAKILQVAYEVYVDHDGVVDNNELVKETIIQASKDTGIPYATIVNKFYETAKQEHKIL